MPVYMNSGKIVADGTGRDGWRIEGSTRGPRGPKKNFSFDFLIYWRAPAPESPMLSLVLLFIFFSNIFPEIFF